MASRADTTFGPTLPDGTRYELDRPHVSAHEGERVSERMQRAMAAARVVLRDDPPPPTCPAAGLLPRGEDGYQLRCAVERNVLTEKDDPTSIVRYCLAPAGVGSGYGACPTWRAEKERQWRGKRLPLVPVSEGV